MPQLQSLLGLIAFCLIAWLFSENRRRVPWRLLAAGLGLQILLAALLLKVPGAQQFFLLLNGAVLALEESTRAGTSLVFGYLGGGTLPFAETAPGAAYILAFRGLPILLVMGALSALLFHFGILQAVVRAMAWALRRSMGLSGALGVGVASNVFIGMTEAPLLIRPYLMSLTRSELFALMTAGMATIAGTMMVLYASLLGPVIPDALGHILTASLISAPAAVLAAGLMIPESGKPVPIEYVPARESESAMDAVTRGTLDALRLLLNVIALLVVLVALVHLVDQIFALLPQVNGAPLTLERMFGWVMAPVMWLAGIPWAEAQEAGALMGVKTVLNEFVAYLKLAELPAGTLSERSRLITVYALCGFANFGSLGILIGGLGSLVPERRAEVVALGMKSLLSGTLATLMTGAVVGMLV